MWQQLDACQLKNKSGIIRECLKKNLLGYYSDMENQKCVLFNAKMQVLLL